MAEQINEKDTLNDGRIKLNNAIHDSEKAKNDSSEAKTTANEAKQQSESTQTQLDTVVVDGDSSVEAAQARVDEKGVSHTTLKDRIDDGFNNTNVQLKESKSGNKASWSVWEEFEQRGVNVKWYGAVGDGLTDDTEAIQNALDTNKAVFFPADEFSISSIIIPKNTVILFNNTKFKRNGGTINFVEVKSNTVVSGSLEMDGNKANIPGGKPERGMMITGSNVVFNARLYTHDNHGHGLRVTGGSNVTVYDTRSEYNGTTYDPDGLGEGDGILIAKATSVRIVNPYTANNSRTGIVVSSPGDLSTQDVVIDNPIIPANNAYNGFNCEYGSNLVINNLKGNSDLVTNNSQNLMINSPYISRYYGDGVKNVKMINVNCSPLTDSKSSFFARGENINIDTLIVHNTATTHNGNAVEIRGTDNQAVVNNMIVKNSYNGLRATGVSSLSNINVKKHTNLNIKVNGRTPLPRHASGFVLEDGYMKSRNGNKPDYGYGYTGEYTKGDIVYNSSPEPGEYVGWICTVGGDPSTWKGFGMIEL